MDFTREPIIETVITPKEGCKLVVRGSKNTAQEEYFVDAVEVVSFGQSFFFRSLERPKAFLVPASDYEVIEVREARMVLKNVGIDRAIKIGGGRDAQMRASAQRDHSLDKGEVSQAQEEEVQSLEGAAVSSAAPAAESKAADSRLDKKRDRRRQYRRRRGREEGAEGGEGSTSEETSASEGKEVPARTDLSESRQSLQGDSSSSGPITTNSILTSLLPPPSTLISETIARYKDNALFKGAFYSKEEPKAANLEVGAPSIALEQPEYGSFEVSEEEEELIYQDRKRDKTYAEVHEQSASVQEESVSQESLDVSTSAHIEESIERAGAPEEEASSTSPSLTQDLSSPEEQGEDEVKDEAKDETQDEAKDDGKHDHS